MSDLTAHDKAILNCVFNPNLPLDENVLEIPQELKDEEEISPYANKCKSMELEAISLSENGKLEQGLKIINDAIELMPNKPSLYNNRAHILQYLKLYDEALEDVSKAINLCSENHKKTLCKAYCLRGILYRRLEKIDEARADFEIAATRFGDPFAKSQMIELNPYAALCNQMLHQVMNMLN